MKRVVITGMAGLSPIGSEWPAVERALRSLRNGVRYMPNWDNYQGLNTRLAAPIEDFELPEHYTRKRTRSMGRVALLATRASELALLDAGLLNDPILTSGLAGVAYGSSSGTPAALCQFGGLLLHNTADGIKANTYLHMMPHTTAVNVGLFFHMTGRIIPTSAACVSGSLAIGFACEAIRYGAQSLMLAGGAEELCATQAAVFDTLFACSTRNDAPATTPRPFDADRDGLVIGEGAASMVLEDLDHAIGRGARIYAEVVGFGTNSDGDHVTQPSAPTMAVAMKLALDDARLPPDAIGYISAHGTATDLGDVAESQASYEIFRRPVPISSMKSYIGHTLGACGALEAWMGIEMMNNDWYAPTINLDHLDPRCADLDYIVGDGRTIEAEYVMSNNFAFGGINTSLVFRRWH